MFQQLELLKAKKIDASIEWQDVADFRAEYIGELEHRDTVRKGSKLLQEYIDAGWNISPSNDKELSSMDSTKLEIQKERIKLQTEKLELNKWMRELSRDELIMEHITSAIKDLEKLEIPDKIELSPDTKGYALIIGDEHYGTEFEIRDLYGEILNSYSPEIFEDRMWILFGKLVEIIKSEGIQVLNIFDMGDNTDGILRVSQLMKLRYGIVESTIKYSEFICNWLNELSKYVVIRYQMTYGNHDELRLINQPKGTFANENMGKVIREFIKTRLENNPNFTMIENPTGYVYANICGNIVLGIHGEVKNMGNAIRELSQIYGVQIDYLIAGHLHHSKTEEVSYNCEVINVPSIIGVDDYSLKLRKTSSAGAKLLVFSNIDGLVCDYRLKVN